ncbi:PepSY domain-containing protein [Subdoligranulum variabile]|uniref:Peptidase propeptide and YPEB domain protein n=1 Tax=Subdoligranulum variabile DSM 15176 TaxID=411471 RepID=D1PI47_9FIRM|nr:PepSY domain-containing protein [Subdoligranulum variabile]EFB77627.1 peptidase propeptide and YPEB domain protein [Subdoligranulum variabile DSM 15176]UWP69284.1 PepSY domain-containing protein [Subdoligranulum variabile]
MKKSTLIFVATAALSALLLTGCAEAAGFNGLRQQATPAATDTPQDAVDVAPQATAQAPVAAPASEPTAGIAGSADPNSGYISEDAAKATALEHAGLAEADLQAVRIKLDYDDGRAVYDVEFLKDTAEYDYELDATTGEILSYDYDAENLTAQTTTGSPVTADQAKQIALNHAGVAESDTRAMELETDRDDGRTVYEFSWKVGFTEYDYEIDADTGAILSYSQEQD